MADDAKPANGLDTLAARARDDAKRSLDSADKLRGRADAFANGVKALGLAAVGWVGFSSLTDVFPWQGDEGKTLTIISVALMLLMAASALALGFYLSYQARPLITNNDIATMKTDNGLSEKQCETISEIYSSHATANGFSGEGETPEAKASAAMNALSAYATQLELRAENFFDPDAPAKPLPAGVSIVEIPDTDAKGEAKAQLALSRAGQIKSEILAVHARVAAIVIRKRVVQATSGIASGFLVAVFAISLVSLWYVADLSRANQAEPTAKATFAKTCADAIKAVNDTNIEALIVPVDCKKKEAGTPSESKSAIIVSVASLSKALSDCRANGPAPDQVSICDTIASELNQELAALAAK